MSFIDVLYMRRLFRLRDFKYVVVLLLQHLKRNDIIVKLLTQEKSFLHQLIWRHMSNHVDLLMGQVGRVERSTTRRVTWLDTLLTRDLAAHEPANTNIIKAGSGKSKQPGSRHSQKLGMFMTTIYMQLVHMLCALSPWILEIL